MSAWEQMVGGAQTCALIIAMLFIVAAPFLALAAVLLGLF